MVGDTILCYYMFYYPQTVDCNEDSSSQHPFLETVMCVCVAYIHTHARPTE